MPNPNRQERQRLARSMHPTKITMTDSVKAVDAIRFFPEMAKKMRRTLSRFEDHFYGLSPAAVVDKRTAFFDGITGHADGSMELLHDIGEALDAQYAFVNDFREPGEPIMVQPFTDANVTYYEANGVSN